MLEWLPLTERVFRAEHGRAVAVLTRVFGDIGIAEESVQDAFTAAVQRWPSAGLPPSPAGWIISTARNRAIALDGYYLFHAIRADFLWRLGRGCDALEAYDAAIARTGNAAELASCSAAATPPSNCCG
jgi:predicted RNA polymerase sigma factor